MTTISDGQTEAENNLILREAAKIVEGLGKTLAPLCEVVLHDLTSPDHAIVRIENNLSGRSVGDAATELGLARISDAGMPDLLVNYTNRLPDGRAAKSSSIGLRNSQGKFIAAICLNFDVSYLGDVIAYMSQLVESKPLMIGMTETLAPVPSRLSIEQIVREFAAKRNVQPRSLNPGQRLELIAELRSLGALELRGALSKVAATLGVSRTSIYHYVEGAPRRSSPEKRAAKAKS